MAEAILRQRIAGLGLTDQVEVLSAGRWATNGQPANEDAITVLAARDISLTGHRSQPLTLQLLDRADIVLVMEEAHRRSIFYLAPKHLYKVLLLTELAGSHDDIDDPYGGPFEGYVNTEAQLETLIDTGLRRLLWQLGITPPTADSAT
jgi:protein-tyrosine phosphatase